MPTRTGLSIPTNGALPDTHRLPATNGDVYKILSRLSRVSLLQLALRWLEDSNVDRCAPFLAANARYDDNIADEESLYLPAQSIEELREVYEELQARKGGKREVVERILEGDWRHGISLYQLAMAETQHLSEKTTSQKWHALRLSLVRGEEDEEDDKQDEEQRMPCFQPQSFLQSLQRDVGPLAKAHYHLTRSNDQYTLLRIFLMDLPYNTQRAIHGASSMKRSASEGAKSIFVVFPNATPFVYVSVPTTTPKAAAATESRSLQKLIIDVSGTDVRSKHC